MCCTSRCNTNERVQNVCICANFLHFWLHSFSRQYFKYIFPDGVDTVIVKVNSDMNFPCSVMSIQDIQVPTSSTQYHHGYYCGFLIFFFSFWLLPSVPSMILTTTWPSLGCTRPWPKKGPSLCRYYLRCLTWLLLSTMGKWNVLTCSSHRPPSDPSHCVFQRKDFPSYSFYVVVVVKTEDEACGGPLRFYPLRPDELFDAGNRTKVLDVMVSPAIKCKSSRRATPRPHQSGLVPMHLPLFPPQLRCMWWGCSSVWASSCRSTCSLCWWPVWRTDGRTSKLSCAFLLLWHQLGCWWVIGSVNVQTIGEIDSKVPFRHLFLLFFTLSQFVSCDSSFLTNLSIKQFNSFS